MKAKKTKYFLSFGILCFYLLMAAGSIDSKTVPASEDSQTEVVDTVQDVIDEPEQEVEIEDAEIITEEELNEESDVVIDNEEDIASDIDETEPDADIDL